MGEGEVGMMGWSVGRLGGGRMRGVTVHSQVGCELRAVDGVRQTAWYRGRGRGGEGSEKQLRCSRMGALGSERGCTSEKPAFISSLHVSQGMSLRVCPPPILGRRPHAKSRLRGSAEQSATAPSLPLHRSPCSGHPARGSDRGPWRVRRAADSGHGLGG